MYTLCPALYRANILLPASTDFSGASPHDIAGVLKLYIRELPQPLVPLEHFQALLDSQSTCVHTYAATTMIRICIHLFIRIGKAPKYRLCAKGSSANARREQASSQSSHCAIGESYVKQCSKQDDRTQYPCA